jgi:hypothetical protein
MPRLCPVTRIARLRLRDYAQGEDGAVLVLVALFLAVAFGFLALAVDFGRVASTQSDMQSYADQVALAAAAELDGRPDAITRAQSAADRLISDWATYASSDRRLRGSADYRLTFLRTLPGDDRAAATATTADGRLARYVQVQANQATVPTPFAAVAAAIRGAAGTQDSSTVAAVAVAGTASYACDVTPLMFCVPNSAWRAENNIGRQIQLRSGGQGAAWGPGNFGFLDPTSLAIDPNGPCASETGAQLYLCLIGAERAVTTCIRTDQGLNTLTGQRNGLANGFNTRFDIYRSTMGGADDNPAYRPAPNTVQGTLPRRNGGGNSPRPACRGNNVDVSDAMALPRDTCITTGSCGRFGNGNWNRTAYVAMNHNGSYPSGTSPSSTRYAVYLAEIAAARSRTPPNNVPLPGKQETGAPTCHALGASTDTARRNLIAAAVDCTANNIQGNTSGVVPLEYVELFLTEPVGTTGNDTNIFVEVIGGAGGFGSGASVGAYRDIVQLYR